MNLIIATFVKQNMSMNIGIVCYPTFGGSGVLNEKELHSEPIPYQGMPFSLMLTLPPLGIVYLKPKAPVEIEKTSGAVKRAAPAIHPNRKKKER